MARCPLLLQVSAVVLVAVVLVSAESKCLCQTTSCLCCVELNLTSSIDLGGPACVNVRHLDRNVSLNLSYGDNPVHNATIALGKSSFLWITIFFIDNYLGNVTISSDNCEELLFIE